MPADTVHEFVESAKPKAKKGPVHLTDKMVERIKPPADNKKPSKTGKSVSNSRKTISDANVTGLQLRITPDGTKSWSLMFTIAGAGPGGVRGSNHRMSLGPYPRISLKEARDKAKDALALADRGRDPRAAKEAEIQRANELAFEVVCDDFIELYAKKKVGSWKRTKRVLEEHVVPVWKGRQIDEISRASAHSLLDELHKTQPKTIPVEVRKQLSKLFNWAVDRDKLPANPMTGMQRPEQRYIPRERVLSMDELKRIWDAAGEVGYPFGDFVRLLILTAQRRTEIADLQRSWLRPDSFVIPPSGYKTARAQVVPLSTPAAKIIDALPVWNGGDYVLSTTSGEHPISGFSKFKERFDKACGVEEWTWHDLRRSAASHMASLGVPPEHVERVLGHVMGGVAGVYNHYNYLKEKREALELWGSKWT